MYIVGALGGCSMALAKSQRTISAVDEAYCYIADMVVLYGLHRCCSL